MSDFKHTAIIQLKQDDTDYRHLTSDYVSIGYLDGKEVLKIDPEALCFLAKTAMHDVSFYLRSKHLEKVAAILDDPEASNNDRYVAATLLRNSMEAAKGFLPTCQDTGTAIVVGKKGEGVWSGADDAKYLSQGIFQTFLTDNLRYSQMIPLDMFTEKNSGSNLPAQIDIYATQGNEYHFLFLAKGGGSANKTFLYQQTKSLLNEQSLTSFIKEKLFSLGTAACPPYHIALVIGGTSAEDTLKTVKLASAGYYDYLPARGNEKELVDTNIGERGIAFRDWEWEKRILKMAQETNIGAQFGGKYLAHDIRVIRLPRHAASCPVGLGVSCSADRNIKAKITKKGLFLEKMEVNPERYRKKIDIQMQPPVNIDLNLPMETTLKILSQYSVGTRLMLKGTLIVARDVVHAKIKEKIDRGDAMPDYFKNYPIYYAGPAKTPEGMPSGSFGPTTASRMDPYVDLFQANGGSLVMIAKGNRSSSVTNACKKHGGFYLGSIGGPAAILAKESIHQVEVIDFAELGMEAIRKIEISNFPAFIICDDKGNNLFSNLEK